MASELEEPRAQNATLQNRVMALELEPHLLKSGAKPEAIDFIVHRLRETYGFGEGGALVAKQSGTVPADWRRWIQTLRTAEPHLFGSTRQVGQGDQTDRSNPWKAHSFNLTQQAKLVKRDFELARTMAAEAGITLG